MGPLLPALRQEAGVDILLEREKPASQTNPTPRVTLIGYGPMASLALETAQDLAGRGIGVRVIDPVWVQPITDELVALVGDEDVVVTIEDGIDAGGLGQKMEIALADQGSGAHVVRCAIPTAFIAHGSRSEILAGLGFTAAQIVEKVMNQLAR